MIWLTGAQNTHNKESNLRQTRTSNAPFEQIMALVKMGGSVVN